MRIWCPDLQLVPFTYQNDEVSLKHFGVYIHTSARMLAEILFSAFVTATLIIYHLITNIDENYHTSQHFDQWYSRFDHFPDDVRSEIAYPP